MQPDTKDSGPPSNGDRLDSWKEIAAYLRQGVRTVQRWEREEGLPVHRPPGKKRGTVYAFRPELDAWFLERAEAASDAPATVGASPRNRRVLGRRAAATAVALSAAAGAAMFLRGWRSEVVEAGPQLLEARVLDNFPEGAGSPSFSPDGLSLAFTWSGGSRNRDIYVQNIEGEEPTRLTTDPGPDSDPSWSPDGGRIAFTRLWPAAAPGHYVLALSSGAKSVVGHMSYGRVGWTPDGRRLIGSGLGEGGAVLTTLPLDTREPKPFETEDLKSFDRHAAVASNGSAAAFARCTTPDNCDVHVRPLEGAAKARRLTFQRGRIEGVAWVPVSTKIVYALDGRLYVVDARPGSAPTPLEYRGGMPPLGEATMPTVARVGPDGAVRLAFRHRARDVDVWVTDTAEGSQDPIELRRRKLIDSPGRDYLAVFSPDGKRIAFVSDRTGAPALWVCDRDGSRQRQLTPVTLRVKESAPSWSPDGESIAFRGATAENTTSHIYTIPLEGGEPRAVTSGKDEWDPQWSRDGAWIYHFSRDGGQPEVWRGPWDGRGPPEPVSRTLAWSFAESPDGQYGYFCGSSEPGRPFGALFRVSLATGRREQIRERFSYNSILFRGADLYFLKREQADGSDRRLLTLNRLVLDTGETIRVAESRDLSGPRHFALSPDARQMLTSHLESSKSRLMLVEDFRW